MPPRPYTAHLDSAARVLERILSDIHPEHHWVVTVRQGDRLDRPGGPAARVGRGKADAVGDDPHAALDRHAPPAPDGRDEHALKEDA